MLFQSDRKYLKMNDRFISSYFDFKNKDIFGILRYKENINFEETIKLIESCYSFGRFSAFLFLETYGEIFECEFSNNKLDWNNGQTVTSGILNVLGKDKR